MTNISEDSINFGKYKNLTIKELLKDRKYCKWLLEQDWFSQQYEYLSNRIKNHDPKKAFLMQVETKGSFYNDYEYFNLTPLNKIELSEIDKQCYSYYLEIINNLREQIYDNVSGNPYNVKLSPSWLKKFEKKYAMSRDIFKEFISSNDLKLITTIIEDIKLQGNIVYKGNKTFQIAKDNSKKQEKFWEDLLKKYYGDNITVQYKYLNCIFDFLNINSSILYECKLSLKNFNQDQFNKYSSIMNTYQIIYLIGYDCILSIKDKILYTTDKEKYRKHLIQNNVLNEFKIKGLEKIESFF